MKIFLAEYRRHTDPNGGYDQNEIKRNKALTYFKQNALYFGLQYKPSSGAEWKMKYVKILVLYSVLFRFGHIRRSDQCAVYILYSKISTDPGLPLKIRHSHRFVAVVIQFLIPLISSRPDCCYGTLLNCENDTNFFAKMIGKFFDAVLQHQVIKRGYIAHQNLSPRSYLNNLLVVIREKTLSPTP